MSRNSWLRLVIPIFALSLLEACGPTPSSPSTPQEAWNPINDPGRFGVGTVVLDSVPTSASLPRDKTGWSADYWPTYKGGIAQRWQTATDGDNYRDFVYDVLTAGQADTLTPSAAAQLSPAEKFDLFMGRRDFPLTRSEKQKTLSSIRGTDVPHWFGICHGWAAASYREKEPGVSARVRTGRGLSLDFSHSDLEALVSYAYSDISSDSYSLIGSRCNADDVAVDRDGRVIADECRDLNPASFHLILANYIATQQRGFLADISNDDEVWNYPLVGYSFRYSNERRLSPSDPMRAHRAPGTVTLVDVVADLQYVASAPSALRPGGSRVATLSMTYSLELDAGRRLIGGEWVGAGRPDFAWDVVRRPISGPGELVDLTMVKDLIAYSRGEGPAPRAPDLDPNDPDDPNDPNDPNDPVDPHALSIVRWDYVSTGARRVTAVVEGHTRPNVAEVRMVLVRPRGARDIAQTVRPGARGTFAMSETFVPRFVMAVAVEALDREGRVLSSRQVPVE